MEIFDAPVEADSGRRLQSYQVRSALSDMIWIELLGPALNSVRGRSD